MNNTVDRRVAGAYPFHVQSNTRFTDTDMGGHLNNVSILLYYQDGLAPFLLDCFAELAADPGWRLRQGRCDVSYDGQAFYPDPIAIASGIEHIGDNWLRVAQALFQRGEYVGQCDTILCMVDDQGQPRNISPDQRTRLESRRLRS
jgi:acyl-CoA thioester hydrolase